MQILLRDADNHNEPSAIITTETLTAEEVQNIIYDMKTEYYDSEVLTDLLVDKGCIVDWIDGDEEVFW